VRCVTTHGERARQQRRHVSRDNGPTHQACGATRDRCACRKQQRSSNQCVVGRSGWCCFMPVCTQKRAPRPAVTLGSGWVGTLGSGRRGGARRRCGGAAHSSNHLFNQLFNHQQINHSSFTHPLSG
jgi:hypothetical protein